MLITNNNKFSGAGGSAGADEQSNKKRESKEEKKYRKKTKKTCASCQKLVNSDLKCVMCDQNIHLSCSATPTIDGV